MQVFSNSTVNSDLTTSNSTLDPVVGATVTGVWWSVTGNTISVVRVVNSTVNVTMATLSGTGDWGKNDGWVGGSDLAGANVVVTFGTSASGTLFLEFSKQYAGGDFMIEHV